MRKWVILSCTPNSIYDFFLPIAVRLWRKRIGYDPVVVLVGTEEEWSFGHARVVHEEILGKERIEFFPGMPDLPDSVVSMGLRQHVAALDFDPDDILLVGDVDLFPLDREFFHRYDPSKNPVGIYYAEMYSDQYWPAYGVSMPVRHWREVMGTVVGDFRGSVEKAFTEGGVRALVAAYRVDYRDTRFWTFDEKYASDRIKRSRFSNDIAKYPSFVGSKYPHRVKLPDQPDALAYVDFHCPRPGWTTENWPGIRAMLAQILPEDLGWIDHYVQVYLSSLVL